jgi:putative ABC transport system permease protein
MSTQNDKARRSPDDFDREIDAHLDLEADTLIEEGVPADEARAAARRRFGSLTAARERYYEAGRPIWMDTLVHDARCAVRSLRRFPIATLVAVLSLGAGIGATAATLTVRNAIFRNAPPLYREPAELSRIRLSRIDRGTGRVPAQLYEQWKALLGASAAAATTSGAPSDVRTAGRTRTIPVRGVSSGLFVLLGVDAEIGSTTAFDRAADRGEPSAVLSFGVWEQMFDRRPDVIGQTIWMDNQPHTVVAVMPQRFWLTDMNSPIWRPLDLRALAPEEPLDVIVRRSPEVSAATLDAQLKPALDAYVASLPSDSRRIRHQVRGIEGTPMGDSVGVVVPYLLGVSVLLTLLIACANVAILMIAQWTAREHEIAIRASIGAGRGRIIRSLLTESILVASCGGAFGLGALFAIRGWMMLRGVGDGRFFDLSIPPTLVAQAGAVTLMAGIVSGIMPAVFETRRLQANPLLAIAGANRVRQRWRNTLVVLEVAVTIGLLVVTSAMIDGYRRVLSADSGFVTRPLIGASVRHRDGVNVDMILARLERLPYVSFGAAVVVATDARGSNGFGARQSAIGPAFFPTLGVRMRSGRPLTTQDTSAGRAVIVNEALARQMFPDGKAVGQALWVGDQSYDIVGVVANYTTNMFGVEHTGPELFLPFASDVSDAREMSFLIRAERDPGPLLQAVRQEIRGTGGGIEVPRLFALSLIRTTSAQEILVGTAPLFPLIAIGLMLTAAGIYGVLAFAITRRARELAVRLAIGATNWDVAWLVGAQAARLVGTGTLVGIAIAFALSRIVRARGGAGSIYDPAFISFVMPVMLLAAVGLLASWVPSRRALKINPAILLRAT